MRKLKLIGMALVLSIGGCATPPEVKQLSIKQIEYFDSAIQAISIQSEALILATERLVEQAKEKIDSEDSSNRARFETLIQQGVPGQAAAAQITQRISDRAAQVVTAKEKLDRDLSDIKAKADELKTYLVKMKEVQLAIDSYIQSKKAGELVVHDVLNQSSVKSLLNMINELTPKIESGVADMKNLLKGI